MTIYGEECIEDTTKFWVGQELILGNVFYNVLQQISQEPNTVLGFKHDVVLKYDPHDVEKVLVLKHNSGSVLGNTYVIYKLPWSKLSHIPTLDTDLAKFSSPIVYLVLRNSLEALFDGVGY